MAKKKKYYSEEAQAIMGTIPSWIIRWGITMIFSVFALIVIGCCIIKYPKIIKAPVVLTTKYPPANLAAKYTGLLDSICVENGDKVTHHQMIALFKTPANYRDICCIKLFLEKNQSKKAKLYIQNDSLYAHYTLGSVQTFWSNYVQQCMDYKNYLNINYIQQKKDLLALQIRKNEEYYYKQKRHYTLLKQEYALEYHSFKRDSTLFQKEIISKEQLEQAKQALLSKQATVANFNTILSSTELSILKEKQQLVELSIQYQKDIDKFERELTQQQQQLLAQIEQWYDRFVIISPIDGIVTLHQFWNSNQHVSSGQLIASVVPNQKSKIIGRLLVPSNGFGKIKLNQTVNVRLNGYPYMEYGVLKGSVYSVSAIPEKIQTNTGSQIVYGVEIHFDNALQTTYNKEIHFIQDMNGEGEIITEDMRLIEHFIQPIMSLLKNN